MTTTTNPITKLDKVDKGTRIAFYGPMCSGKTFAANYLRDHYDYHVYSLASKLKAIVYELYGTQSKDGKGREILQQLGDIFRKFDDDVFIKYTLAWIDHEYPKSKVVIDDLRLPREAHLLRANGFQIIEIECDEKVREGRVQTLYPNVPQQATSHSTEQSYQKIRRDGVINASASVDTIIGLEKLIHENSISR